MPVKPTTSEEEYFARQEAELKKKLAAQRQTEMEESERQRLRELHYMRCPKCGMQLEEISFGEIRVDKCLSCEGLWLDKGEIDAVRSKEPGFIGRFFGSVRS